MTVYTKPDSQARGIVPDIETLETVAAWKESLQTRLRLARLRFELIGGNTEEVVSLGAEVEDFRRLCSVLKECCS
jgi:hypothetical protein